MSNPLVESWASHGKTVTVTTHREGTETDAALEARHAKAVADKLKTSPRDGVAPTTPDPRGQHERSDRPRDLTTAHERATADKVAAERAAAAHAAASTNFKHAQEQAAKDEAKARESRMALGELEDPTPPIIETWASGGLAATVITNHLVGETKEEHQKRHEVAVKAKLVERPRDKPVRPVPES